MVIDIASCIYYVNDMWVTRAKAIKFIMIMRNGHHGSKGSGFYVNGKERRVRFRYARGRKLHKLCE